MNDDNAKLLEEVLDQDVIPLADITMVLVDIAEDVVRQTTQNTSTLNQIIADLKSKGAEL